jgi:TRAP transporter TAXI family solute receptor
VRLGQASAALADGQIDAFFLVGGPPVPAIADLAAAMPLRLLDVPGEVADRLKDQARLFRQGAISGSTYKGIDEDVETLTVKAIWLTSAEMPEPLIYGITRAFWSDATQRILAARHPLGKRIHVSAALDGIGIPLHPGAERYYREIGLAIDAPEP